MNIIRGEMKNFIELTGGYVQVYSSNRLGATIQGVDIAIYFYAAAQVLAHITGCVYDMIVYSNDLTPGLVNDFKHCVLY